MVLSTTASGMSSRVPAWQTPLITPNSSSGQHQPSQWMVQLRQAIRVSVLNA